MTKTKSSLPVRCLSVGSILLLVCLSGCPAPRDDRGAVGPGEQRGRGGESKTETGPAKPSAAARVPTAKAEDVAAAQKLVDGMGASAKYALSNGVLTSVVVQDGSTLSAEHVALFGRLTDLEQLQIHNCRSLNDEMAAQLAGLKQLKSLALTNSIVGDATVELIAKAFPLLTDLDLSSNTNISNSSLKVICGMANLQRLTVVQDRFNDLGTSHLSKLTKLRFLDLRGNMEAGDMTLEVLGGLPQLAGLKHRSTAVSDFGMESLAQSQSLDSLLIQDFPITDRSGEHIAKLKKLTQLEVFRCQGFASEGVLALKGIKLTRLTLRDLPAVDDRAMEVFAELPELKRLYLHELASVSDSGLQQLSALKSLELLDIWNVPQLTDAALDVIATLPNLKELSLRTTGVTDVAVDKLLAMPNLQVLTFKDNGAVTAEALQKLSGRKFTKLDTGTGGSAEPASP